MATWNENVLSFFRRLEYALVHSGYEDIVLKQAQILALDCIYNNNDTIVVLPTGYGKSVIFHLLPWLLSKCEDYENKESGGIVIVISPLNALICDQIRKLQARGLVVSVLDKPKPATTKVRGSDNDEVISGCITSNIFAESENESCECGNAAFLSSQLSRLSLSHGIDDGNDSDGSLVHDASVGQDDTLCRPSPNIVYCHPEAVICPSKDIKALLLGDVYQKKVVACIVDEAHCVVEWGMK